MRIESGQPVGSIIFCCLKLFQFCIRIFDLIPGIRIQVLKSGFRSWNQDSNLGIRYLGIRDSGLGIRIQVLESGFRSWNQDTGLGIRIVVLELRIVVLESGFRYWNQDSGLGIRMQVLESGLWSWN
jgi:hypothetical protein